MTKLRDVGHRKARNQALISTEERRHLFSLVGHMPLRESAKLLGVGVETMMALIDPFGRVSPETVSKIREKLQSLPRPEPPLSQP